jgi:hypothetical protein
MALYKLGFIVDRHTHRTSIQLLVQIFHSEFQHVRNGLWDTISLFMYGLTLN